MKKMLKTRLIAAVATVLIVGCVSGNAFANENASSVIAPYWQADPGSYTFMAVSHSSLTGMSSAIGVVMNAIQSDGTTAGTLSFTVTRSGTQRLFIATTNNASINPVTQPNARVLVIDSTTPVNGNLLFRPSAANVNVCAAANASHCDFPEINELNFWGAVVVQATATGFAMEFVGDQQDSRAFNTPNFSGVN